MAGEDPRKWMVVRVNRVDEHDVFGIMLTHLPIARTDCRIVRGSLLRWWSGITVGELGHGSNRQRTGSTVVVAGRTPRRTCGRRTGMATTRATVTTTWAFAAPAHEGTGWFLPEQTRVLSVVSTPLLEAVRLQQ